MAKLRLDAEKVALCRRCAKGIADDLQKMIEGRTSVSVERAVLRLFGLDGVNTLKVPYPNVVIERVHEAGLLHYGIANVISYMMYKSGDDFQSVVSNLTGKRCEPVFDDGVSRCKLEPIIQRLCGYGLDRIEQARAERAVREEKYPVGEQPWLYAIVATGNIYEDVKQARSAVRCGAQCIAVIRSTAQSLMDYVPCGATIEGFGGTYATQENFRIMRAALDELTEEIGRYVYLVNYCSGLCMSEIAAMGAVERLDMMLNDAMYGIIFRDINMYRTFVDQHFSRMINAQAGIIINTGEDNYLTTADAVEKGHTVPVSDFINEQMAKNSGLKESQLGLGHAFEIDPDMKNSFVYEIAMAQLIRQLFPKSPIKYMPPTKHVHGDIFRTHSIDTMFNLASVFTGQSIHLTGMLTEGIHTPLIHDRCLSLEAAGYVMNAARDLGSQMEFKPNCLIEKRASKVLDECLSLLKKIEKIGLCAALEKGYFADIRRPKDGGKGSGGVIERHDRYVNPFEEKWRKQGAAS